MNRRENISLEDIRSDDLSNKLGTYLNTFMLVIRVTVIVILMLIIEANMKTSSSKIIPESEGKHKSRNSNAMPVNCKTELPRGKFYNHLYLQSHKMGKRWLKSQNLRMLLRTGTAWV